jgi:hypothetical protein
VKELPVKKDIPIAKSKDQIYKSFGFDPKKPVVWDPSNWDEPVVSYVPGQKNIRRISKRNQETEKEQPSDQKLLEVPP